MLLPIAKAAELTGRSRKTLYAHIKDGKISAKTDNEGNKVIDTSELLRVYGLLQKTPIETPKNPADIDQAEKMRLWAHKYTMVAKENLLLRDHLKDLRAQLESSRHREKALFDMFNRILPPSKND